MHQQCAKAHHRMQVTGSVDDGCPPRCLAERHQRITGAGHDLPSVHLRESGEREHGYSLDRSRSAVPTPPISAPHAIQSGAAVRALCYRV